jgi:hypothetical protein
MNHPNFNPALYFPTVSHVLKFTGMAEVRVPVKNLVENDIFRFEEGLPVGWWRATGDAYLTEGTTGGYTVSFERTELLLENK